MKFNLNHVKEIVTTKTFASHPIGDSFLDSRYQNQIDETGNPSEYYRYFYYLTKAFQPRLTVELGGWQGTAAAHLAAGYPDGQVISIDHHTDPGDEIHQGKMIEATREYKNLVYIQGWTWDVIDQVREYGEIDILFIDSWHDYEHAMRDWNDYQHLLADEALVICDDIIGGYGTVISGMEDFWNELEGDKFLVRDIHSGMDGIPIGFLKYVRPAG